MIDMHSASNILFINTDYQNAAVQFIEIWNSYYPIARNHLCSRLLHSSATIRSFNSYFFSSTSNYTGLN